MTLKAAFPELYSITCCKEVSVAEFVQFSHDTLLWNIIFLPDQRLIERWIWSLHSLIVCTLLVSS